MKKLFVLIMIVSVASLFVFAADAQKIINDMQMHYEDFEKSIDDMKMTNTMNIDDEEGSVDMDMTVYKKGEKFRFDVTVNMDGEGDELGPINTVFIYDGNEMWMVVPIVGKQKVEDEEEMDDYDSVMEMFWWNSFGSDPQLIGTETVEGKECHIIKFNEIPDDYEGFEKIWVSKKDNILIKAVSEENDDEYVMFKDYKDVYKGYKLPYKTVFYSEDDVEEMVIDIESIDINKGIGDDIFDVNNVEVDNSGMENFLQNMFNQ